MSNVVDLGQKRTDQPLYQVVFYTYDISKFEKLDETCYVTEVFCV